MMEAYILVKELEIKRLEQVFKSGQEKEIYWMGTIEDNYKYRNWEND